jgi:hypothetical protein
MAIVIVNDATHAGIASLPKGQLAAGYSTGSGIVPWTAADWAAHPGAVRIDQSPVNTALDEQCDVLDVERGAATFADCAPWAKAALSSYRTAARPGQRAPAIYMSLSDVTNVANALIGGGVTGGVGLWVANWDNNLAAESAKVLAGSGPFPVIGVQFRNAGSYDVSVVSSTWLNAVSAKAAPPAAAHYTVGQVPPGVWKAGTSVTCSGTGTDGHQWHASYDGKTWSAPVRQ